MTNSLTNVNEANAELIGITVSELPDGNDDTVSLAALMRASIPLIAAVIRIGEDIRAHQPVPEV